MKLFKNLTIAISALLIFSSFFSFINASWANSAGGAINNSVDPNDFKVTFMKVAYSSDGTYYRTIDEALADNNNEESNPKKDLEAQIYIIPTEEIISNYGLTKNQFSLTKINEAKTINSTVCLGGNKELILPYTGQQTMGQTTSSTSSNIFSDSSAETMALSLSNSIKLNDDVKLTIPSSSSLIVGGYIRRGNTGLASCVGATATYNKNTGKWSYNVSKYSQIVLEKNSQIICEGTMDVWGYIKETYAARGTTSIEILNGGSLTTPLTIYDLPGGTATTSADSNNVFPYLRYSLVSVCSKIKVYFSGSLYLAFKFYATGTSPVDTKILAISKSSGIFIFDSSRSDSYCEWQHTEGDDSYLSEDDLVQTNASGQVIAVLDRVNKTLVDGVDVWDSKKTNLNRRTYLNVFGKASIGKIVFSITVDAIFGVTTTRVDSSKYYLPFSFEYQIKILSNSELSCSYRVKFLPGATVTVEEDATLIFENHAMFYVKRKCNDKTLRNYAYGAGEDDTSEANCKDYIAKLINSGTVQIKKGFGGKIYGKTSNVPSKARVIVGNNFQEAGNVSSSDESRETTSLGSREMLDTDSNFTVFKFDSSLKYSSGPDVDTSFAKLLAGTTYLGNNDDWYIGDVSYINLHTYNGTHEETHIITPSSIAFSKYTLTGKPESLERANMLFVGWSKSSTRNTVDYYEGEVFDSNNIDEHATNKVLDLYDVWEIDSSIDTYRYTFQTINRGSHSSIVGTTKQSTYEAAALDEQVSFESLQNGDYYTFATGSSAGASATLKQYLQEKQYVKAIYEDDQSEIVTDLSVDSYFKANDYSGFDKDRNVIFVEYFKSNEATTYTITPRLTRTSSSNLPYNGGEDTCTISFTEGEEVKTLLALFGDSVSIDWESSDDTISVTPSGSPAYTATIKNSNTGNNGSDTTTIKASIKYENSIVLCFCQLSVTFEKKQEGLCVLPNTLVTMADGTQKEIKYVKAGDMVKVFNHETGMIDVAPVTFNEKEEYSWCTVIYLEFSNGKRIGVISEHGFFDLNTMKYEYINERNYMDFIGHKFYEESGQDVILTNAYVVKEYTECYELPSYYHLNYFTEGILSMPGGITGLFNIFEYAENLQYDQEKYQQDIETYGLFTYEDLAPLGVTEIMFDAYAGKYLKVALGKGILTMEYLEYLIERYGGFTE